MNYVVFPVLAALGLATFAALAVGYPAQAPEGGPPTFQTFQPGPSAQQPPSPSSALHTFSQPPNLTQAPHLTQAQVAARVSQAVHEHPQAAMRIINAYQARR